VRRRAWQSGGLALVCVCLAVLPLARRAAAGESFVPTPPTQANYMLHCMGCHAADGAGAAGKVPSLRDSLVPLSMTAAGRRYLVQVPGVARSTLSDREVAQLLGWMVRNLSARSAPAEFAEFTAVEVAAYRRFPLIEVRQTRTRLLAQGGRGSPPQSPP
jgi:mono/diheme cytochrome c family protein